MSAANARSIAAAARVERRSPSCIAVAAALLGVAVVLLALLLFAFEALLGWLALSLSTDGVVEGENRARFAALLGGSAFAAAVAGGGALALADSRLRRPLVAAVEFDVLARAGRAVPNPYTVLVTTSVLGAFFAVLWYVGRPLGGTLRWLYSKEGPLEYLSFALDLSAAALCAVAAVRWRTREPGWRRARPLYALCAFVLLFIGMEEVGWGQTILAWETPAAWEERNYQGETTLHNLLDSDELVTFTQIVALVFGVGTAALLALAVYRPRSVFAPLAPPPALVPLAALAVYSGLFWPAEIVELLLAVFFTYYGYRIMRATRSPAAAPRSG